MEGKTLCQQIEECCNDFCLHYCKYPNSEEYKAKNEDDADLMQQKMLDEVCEFCPLNKII